MIISDWNWRKYESNLRKGAEIRQNQWKKVKYQILCKLQLYQWFRMELYYFWLILAYKDFCHPSSNKLVHCAVICLLFLKNFSVFSKYYFWLLVWQIFVCNYIWQKKNVDDHRQKYSQRQNFITTWVFSFRTSNLDHS